jgi:hypothetical protein
MVTAYRVADVDGRRSAVGLDDFGNDNDVTRRLVENAMVDKLGISQ